MKMATRVRPPAIDGTGLGDPVGLGQGVRRRRAWARRPRATQGSADRVVQHRHHLWTGALEHQSGSRTEHPEAQRIPGTARRRELDESSDRQRAKAGIRWVQEATGEYLIGALAALALLTAACSEGPRDDYQAYRSRTAAYHTDAGTGPVTDHSALHNIEGRWLLNSLLFGGIEVGLRVIFEAIDDQDPPQRYSARIWLWDMPEDAEPLVTTETELDEEGRFVLVADPLNLPGAVLNRDDPVEAVVYLHARIPDAGHWCGNATGEVTRPLSLPLSNATFNAVPDPDGDLDLADVAFRCTDEPEPEPPADAGVGPVERPEGPDFSAYPSTYRDLTGDWLFTADFDIPLQLWLSLRAIPNAEGGGSLDGALRSTRADPGTPALATFTTQVDAEGRFEIWLPDFVLSVGRLDISADILLTAVTLEDGFCGGTAGAIREPEAFAQSLDITYRTVAFVPGEGANGNAPNACP